MNESPDFAAWRDGYVEGDESPGPALAVAWCPGEGCDRRVGIVWRHPTFGLLWETEERTYATATERPGGPSGWQRVRAVLPLDPTVTWSGGRWATCNRGHSGHPWMVNLTEAAQAIRRRGGRIPVYGLPESAPD